MIFFWCSSAFDVELSVCAGSLRLDSVDVIMNNPFFITSNDSFQKMLDFIAFEMQIADVDAFC